MNKWFIFINNIVTYLVLPVQQWTWIFFFFFELEHKHSIKARRYRRQQVQLHQEEGFPSKHGETISISSRT
jgi:hypothetical protein